MTVTASAAPSGRPTDVGTDSARSPGMVRLALTLGAFVAIGPLAIDMYLRALPTIRRDWRRRRPPCV